MLRAKSLSRVPRSSIALILSLSSKHDGMTGLPVALKLDLILVVAVLDAALSGLFGVEFEVLGVALKGVGAPLNGVCGSEGAGEGGLLSLSLSKLEGSRSISTPPLSVDTGDTKYIQPRWMSYLILDLLYMKTSFG